MPLVYCNPLVVAMVFINNSSNNMAEIISYYHLERYIVGIIACSVVTY